MRGERGNKQPGCVKLTTRADSVFKLGMRGATSPFPIRFHGMVLNQVKG
jgi:hypothetical protein